MSNRTLLVVPMAFAASATQIHDGTNSPAFPHQVEGFVAQALGDVHFGGPTVSGDADGYSIRRGDASNIIGFLSRGSYYSYDLTKLYYVGGPWKLIIERSVT